MPNLFRRPILGAPHRGPTITQGVQAVAVDAERRVQLVRHGYRAGWHFPGGDVQHNETVEVALHRELLEETGIVLRGAPRLIGLYAHFDVFPGDHIVLYSTQDWERKDVPAPNYEIAEQGFFATDDLPDETTQGSRRRIAEMLSGQTRSRTWWGHSRPQIP